MTIRILKILLISLSGCAVNKTLSWSGNKVLICQGKSLLAPSLSKEQRLQEAIKLGCLKPKVLSETRSSSQSTELQTGLFGSGYSGFGSSWIGVDDFGFGINTENQECTVFQCGKGLNNENAITRH